MNRRSNTRILFNTHFNHESVHFMLLILRLAIGGFMLVHGLQKFMDLLNNDAIQFADPIDLGPEFTFYLAIFAECFCSIALLFGVLTRFAVVPLIITMFVAAFVVHGPDGFGEKELGLLYLIIYLFFLVVGPGKYSIDRLINPSSGKRRH